MEPDYNSLDPEERTNKLLAIFSISFGIFSLCAGLIPIAGILLSLAGLGTGFFGRKSEYKKLAMAGIIVSALGLLLSFVYGIFLLIQSNL